MKTVFFDVKIVELLTKTVKIILKLAQENPQFFYQAFLKSIAYQTKVLISLKINQQFIFDVVFFHYLKFNFWYISEKLSRIKTHKLKKFRNFYIFLKIFLISLLFLKKISIT
ncbi:hypothetical protein [Mesomycoplasma hyopneumoniae]|uniref:hypothetical protein n=1 Tax=Mesomycoplasma hyopneumoniae TaxID=2099 RepID=UPI00215D9D53|nr:hypothetical protein [Mesomycoplasma hyopneumoniae]